MNYTNSFVPVQDIVFPFTKFHLILLSIASFIILTILKNRSGSKVVWDWPIFGMIPTIIANNDRLLDHAASILRDFKHTLLFKGPSFMNADFMLTCDPENVNHIYNTHFDNYPKGDDFIQIFDVLGDGIFNANGESWMVQRKMAHTYMSDKRFKSCVEKCTREKVSNVLLPLMNHFIEHDQVVDFSDVFLRFTFDTTCALVLGVDPGCLHPDFHTIPFEEASSHMEEVLLFRHTVPMFFWKLLNWLQIGKERRTSEATEVVNHFIYRCIREKREAPADNLKEGAFDHLLTPYLKLTKNNSNDACTFSDKFIRDTLLTFIAAGKDTTSSVIIWFFWLVSTHPKVEKNILEELRKLKPKSTKMAVLEAEEMNSLVYLHAAICETLRLYPPVPFNHKQPVKDDILPSGHKVYRGMKVIVSSYAMGRMEGIWGKDCLEFKPERWITGKGTIRHEPSYKFIAFHSGPRSCLGKNMAFAQIKLVVAAMLYNFEIHAVEGYVARPKVSIVTQPKNGLPMKLRKRTMFEDVNDQKI